jgi:choline-sulfatase
MGDYFKAAGCRSLYRGKWHVPNADLQIPGTHDQIVSYTDSGERDAQYEALYQEADRLSGRGVPIRCQQSTLPPYTAAAKP